MQLHNQAGVKKHRCEVCERAFRYPREVERHKHTHDIDGRRFSCMEPGCKRSFTRNDNLLRHMRKHATSETTTSASDPLRLQDQQFPETAEVAFDSRGPLTPIDPQVLIHFSPGDSSARPTELLTEGNASMHETSTFVSCAMSGQTTGFYSSGNIDPRLLVLHPSS